MHGRVSWIFSVNSPWRASASQPCWRAPVRNEERTRAASPAARVFLRWNISLRGRGSTSGCSIVRMSSSSRQQQQQQQLPPLFLSLRGDFVQLPSTVCSRLLWPTFTSIRPVLSLSHSCFCTRLPSDYYVGWKSCLTGSCSYFFLLHLLVVLLSSTLGRVPPLADCGWASSGPSSPESLVSPSGGETEEKTSRPRYRSEKSNNKKFGGGDLKSSAGLKVSANIFVGAVLVPFACERPRAAAAAAES